MQQHHGRPAIRERRDDNRRQFISAETQSTYRERRTLGEPAKFNSRVDQRRISWENDLYERQSA